ncbi:hypothetical protein N7536_010772 [Penicillium majusculum]|uniref:RTA1 like protein n=1 Tax=Penicillium solitum TaxID=60172 RepID=A0A1V6QZ39_9EURO|nr:uncharacterized protein PENSOL_c026G02172 [Penicillium solitum]KAJ5688153.1 hypothetical protein N7536_010772 [Penicillium majusculum]OQD94459.1 hypothetical protein PENSOL_c026G02172 [Penicillium solitum]
MSTTDDPSNPYYTYYKPSIPAAIAVAILFCAVSLVQIWRIIRTRQWFGIVILVATAFEVIGLLARADSSKHLQKKSPYEIQTILILLAPILFAASVYMFLGRLIRKSGHPELSFIRINWVTPIFVTGDIFCFFVQAVGVVILLRAESRSKLNLAKAIILAGLGLQVFFFAIFALVAVLFHIRLSSRRGGKVVHQGVNVNIRLWNLYLCSVLITVRNIYRLVEYATGTDAYLSRHEWPAYALDIGLMFIIMVISNFWYFRKTKDIYEPPAFSTNSEYPLAEQRLLEPELAHGQSRHFGYHQPPGYSHT